MEVRRLVIDTGVFIEFLRASDKTKTNLYNLSEEVEIFISAVTLYELLIGATSDQKKSDVQLLAEYITVLPFTEEVAKIASEIYHRLKRENKMIEIRDLFIAATCLVNDIKIFTLNKKHFKRVKGLLIV